MNAYAKMLRDHPLFQGLSARVLSRLTANASILEFSKGSVVVEERDVCDALFAVISGRCQATMTTSDGSQQVLAIYGPGETFGERALLGRDRFWTTIHVVTDCTILRIEAADVLRVVDKSSVFEKGLEKRVYDLMRTIRREDRRGRLQRVAVFCGVSEHARGSIIAQNVASALRKESGRSVLNVEVALGDDGPTLSDCDKFNKSDLNELRKMAGFRKEESGLWELRVNAKSGGDEVEFVAPLIGHLARHARYLVIHVGHEVPGPIVQEFLVQSDLPYILLTQRPDDIYRTHLLVRQLRDHPSSELVSVLPVVCLDDEERAIPYVELDSQVGGSVHGFIHGLPMDSPDAHNHYLQFPEGRFGWHIRYLAREIGRRRIGLALSAGGAKSLAHIGVIQVLEGNGIDVDVVAGSSMGGLVGALWSYGLSGDKIEHIARRIQTPWGRWRLIDPTFPPRRGFIRGTRSKHIVRQAIGDAHFSDMKRQLRIVATDLNTLEKVVFDSGEVAPIVQASMAMPGIVVPVKLNGGTLVDGGVSDPMPVDVLMRMGVEKIIAVNTIPNPEDMKSCAVLYRETGKNNKRSPLTWLNRRVNVFAGGNFVDIVAKSMHGAETRVAEGACKQADVVLRPVVCEGRWHDFANAVKYVELGRRVAQENIDELIALAQ